MDGSLIWEFKARNRREPSPHGYERSRGNLAGEKQGSLRGAQLLSPAIEARLRGASARLSAASGGKGLRSKRAALTNGTHPICNPRPAWREQTSASQY